MEYIIKQHGDFLTLTTERDEDRPIVSQDKSELLNKIFDDLRKEIDDMVENESYIINIRIKNIF